MGLTRKRKKIKLKKKCNHPIKKKSLRAVTLYRRKDNKQST